MAPKVLEVEGKIEQLTLPIVTFPPFKLRAQLIEKDPVVWLHLLDTYIQYFQFLNTEENLSKLDDSTLDHLCMFMRSYINEMGNEEGKLLSLGINHDVQENLTVLRAWVLTALKTCGLFYLQIFGETLWNFVILYVEKNPVSVRSLIDGSAKPKITNIPRVQVNRISQIQQHIKSMVEQNKFTRIDLKSFQFLIEDKDFADKFLTINWIEYLESWWDKGNNKFSKIAEQLMITCLLQVRRKTVVDVTKSLGVSSLDTLSIYPLLGSILISERFNILRPDIKQEMVYLNFSKPNEEVVNESSTSDIFHNESNEVEVSQKDISALADFFPGYSTYQLSELLRRYDNNVELITNLMFEDPTIVDSIPSEKPASNHVKSVVDKESLPALEELELHENSLRDSEMELSELTKKHVPDEIKNKTLTRALQLLYDDDEDERDDTYDEAETDRSKVSGKISFGEDIDENNDSAEATEKERVSKYDQIEGYLWQLLKEDATLFERTKRGSKMRKSIKQETTWSDEQIEGWARMLQKSPQRARILEEKYMFRGNVKSGKRSYVKNRDGENDIDNKRRNERYVRKPKVNVNVNNNENSKESTPKNDVNQKRKNARNEKNKASRGNHNRKAGHDKKALRAMP
ncbi:similar to Saccharomyces cerevisiae YGL110C CUE3 Protein of unknown function [Maudiozyma barnettii]|uniref:CUE domain-containing protein n=1 Tax=Maudiozyma barnettii TaxID=61262 RepID=A0A8H2VEZ1_9SACH|nr:Cue3p [Kazachstania barnettii]CAB4254256.1 similar to Saccharomyces cerevisiae YGL110C CUE3 Protein of unknown function [Kazachstania barnettii]CAD1782023.1 similar to Saccharomyces cerevisiae YGL110C CUE3 Protein of unknown function [Kazachstania barnettii]